jgi:hypothetical protein
MKLITETIQDIKYITEESDGAKSMYIVGPYMVAEEKNRNGRVYSQPILESAVTSYVNNFVKPGRALGELGHPENPTVNLNQVSHSIKSLVFEGNVCVGKAKILNTTPMGKIAESLIKEGVKLGVSSRGMGSLKEMNGVNYVQPDFMIAAVDIVADPSAPGAFVNGIMEGKEWIWENGIIKEVQLENYKNKLNNTPKRLQEETQLKIFEHFLSKFKNI